MSHRGRGSGGNTARERKCVTTVEKRNMSTKAKTKARPRKSKSSNIIWFEIPADEPERAKKFYSTLFGWKINMFPGMIDYWHIDTGGGDDTPDGGLLARKHPQQPITNYVNVESV